MSPRESFLLGLVGPVEPEPELHGCHFAGRWGQVHGEHCSCRLLAAATGTEPSSIDYAYCHGVLQHHWRVICDHDPNIPRRKVTREPGPHDPGDPLHALLIANADISAD